ncbi:MAG: site-specific integrase [Lachnospiraceae bacterium]|nr:site-specific integrase [Lachnospiraceae bacterium]
MTLREKISTFLSIECMLNDKAQVQEYIMNRKQSILSNHINNVCRIYEPGEAGQKYYMTKLNPKDRNHAGKIYAKTKEELEEKIIGYYLKIYDEEKVTIRQALINALGGDESNLTKTAKRTLQRFDKNLEYMSHLKITQLTETQIRQALDTLVSRKPTEKEFNETITCLNKISDYCEYEHMAIINIRSIISTYRKVKLTGKHIWKVNQKQTKNLAFSRSEASRIVRDALRHPSYKSFAIAIMITTGLRVGELLGLEIDDIYLEDGYIWIHQIEDTKSYELLNYVKENKAREVYLSSEALSVIRACIEFRMLDDSKSPFLLLNANSKDGKMHLRAIDDHLRNHEHKIVLGYNDEREARSPHDCRRTYASLEYLNGTDVFVLMRQMGHANVSQTWDYIKDVAEASERRSQLKGSGLLYEVPKPFNIANSTVDAVWTQKVAK